MAGKRRHVALIVETSINFGRGVLRGIARYQREQGGWSVFLEQRELGAELPEWIDHWQGDGVVTRSDDPRVLQAKLPTVGLFDHVAGDGRVPMILNDSREVGRLAAEHLLDRGFKHVAFYGVPTLYWSRLRLEGVQAEVKRRGARLYAFTPEAAETRRLGWEESQERLADWIAGLPQPLGLAACNDIHGLRALDACRRRNLAAPEQVAVIGADDDAELCELSDPPLSSVAFHPERVGYTAAAVLDAAMSGRRTSRAPTFIAPRGVVARRSSDVTALEDRRVAQALHEIRKHACDGLTVSAAARAAGSSRRALELGFRKALGRTPKEEIQRVRLETACMLLSETELPITAVSAQVGFHQASRFGAVFKAAFGCTPSEYRKRETNGIKF